MEVVDLVERSRRECRAFDPETDDPAVPLSDGIGPIVALYAAARRDGVRSAPVERSLLEGVLDDWLIEYARCRGRIFPGGYTIYELATAASEHDTLRDAVESLLE